MQICVNCGAESGADAYFCPVCKNRLRLALLARETTSLDRAEDETVARFVTGQQIDRGTAMAVLQASQETSLDLGLLAPSVPSVETLIAMVDSGSAAEVTLEKISLGSLFGKGREANIVHKGLLFLRRHLFAEALEWWTLHRQDSASNERFDLLLLLMEMYTHQLATHPDEAAQIRNEVKRHPIYARMRA